MELAPGSRLGPYLIVAPLGAGGMGEVYRATDTRLGRDVALKLLPEAFACDHERLARFEREAKLLASLSHPGIASLFAFEQLSGTGSEPEVRVLVMELAPGEDLAERLKRGPIPVEDAILIARLIAEAVEEAHERGVVHRDLKPANVKLAPNGKVKVLDFGLAKAWSGDSAGAVSGASAALSQSPTLAHTGTAAGLVLGTAAYMSPEQARGRPVDKRADVWAFGVVLYEMLTGRRLFSGETVTDVLASVVKDPIEWSALPAATPARVRTLLERCLERDPKRRLRDMGEARLALEAAGAPARETAASASRARSAAWLGLVALVAAAVGAVTGSRLLSPAPHPRVTRFTETLPAEYRPTGVGRKRIALSPDGRQLVFVANDRLYVRSLDSLAIHELPGSVGARAPFFSADGAWVIFFGGTGMMKVRLRGGEPMRVAEVEGGASGPADDTILTGGGGYLVGGGYLGITRIARGGSTSEVLVAPEPGYVYFSPQVLPDGRQFLYSRMPPGAPAAETILRSFDRDDPVVVLRSGFDTRYAASGHLLYSQSGNLMAVAFDPAARRVLSDPVVVAAQVMFSPATNTAQTSLSASGTLAYIPGRGELELPRLAAVSRAGKASSLSVEARGYSDLRIAPDGRRIAAHLVDDQNDIWVVDPARGALTRLSLAPGEDETPVWSPDGRYVAWAASRADVMRGVFRRASDGSGGEELLWKSNVHSHVSDWSPDARTLVIELQDPKTGSDIWLLTLEGRQAAPFLKTPFGEHSARISPDGRFVAYVSNESGRDEVYVATFPGPGTRLQVSASGGGQPVWARDGRAILFRDEGAVQEARFDPATNTASAPIALFPDRFDTPQIGSHTTYDVFPDGRLLMIEAQGARAIFASDYQIVFVLGFLEELRARVRPDR